MTLYWQFHHPRMTMEHLGLIPGWLHEEDPRGIAEQMDAHYGFGGFKQYPISGYKVYRAMCLKYPGDPLMRPLATLKLRDETLAFYDHAICAVFDKDEKLVVAARFD